MSAPSSSRMRHVAAVATLLLAIPGSGGVAAAQSLTLTPVASGLANPVSLANAGDGSNRLFIVEQAGTIQIYSGGQVLPTPFLDISSKVVSGGEQGLLGLAFDPNYAANGFFYVYYTSQSAGSITISRYSVTADPNVADPSSEFILKTQAHPNYGNHNGGSLLFGPDGCLYAGIGDGGGSGDPSNNAQNLGTLLGKIIRISASDGTPCAVAPGNPFVGVPGALGEIWGLGLRNPWRITFDRQTGDLLIADVGESSREEVDFQPAGTAGLNYCWSHKEGTLIFNPNVPCTSGTPTDPVLEYDHSAGRCAIIGGYRYRGSRLPSLLGTYLYGDLCTGEIFAATESAGTWTSAVLLQANPEISSFGQDEVGEVYVLHLDATAGVLYRLSAAAPAVSHDFNGDGKSDIAWRQSGGAAAAWLMNGAQAQQSGGFGVVPGNWQIVGQRDFNGDGYGDLLWRDSNTQTVAIWLMNGLQVSQAGSLGVVPGNWVVAGTSDFNDDGLGDILWRDSNTGTVAIWLMNGLQVGQAGSLGAVPANWSIAATDGKGSIFWRDSNTTTVAIWLVSGLQITQAAALGVVPPNWTIVGTGDFDGNGSTDILWRDSNTGTVAVWLMNGVQVSQAGSLGFVPGNWVVAETGDFNGDGMTDILWRDTTGGTVAVWFLNGLQVSSFASVAGVGLDWTIQGLNAD